MFTLNVTGYLDASETREVQQHVSLAKLAESARRLSAEYINNVYSVISPDGHVIAVFRRGEQIESEGKTLHSFRVQDPNCGKTFVITVTADEYKAWKDGALIQNAMPNLTQGQRELLISGTCPECWKSMTDDLVDEPRSW